MWLKKLYAALFFRNRFYLAVGVIIVLLIIGFFVPPVFPFAKGLIWFLLAAVLLDIAFLFSSRKPFHAARIASERFSNGDENKVTIQLTSAYPLPVNVTVIDELPYQFQQRDFKLKVRIKPVGKPNVAKEVLDYTLRPTERGVYEFGAINVFIDGYMGLARRRMVFEKEQPVKVYPAFQQLRSYELFAVDNKLDEHGMHSRRVIGHSMEFDHIKEYAQGDDVRSINWKATARRGNLMVNNFMEEKAQQIYCLIDKGRSMKMPFDGLTLLDYAINSSLIFSKVALNKGDKAGIVAFAEQKVDILPADSKKVQLNKILEMLYAQQTQWQESDYERLAVTLRTSISQRSLFILFTNFESLSNLERQLPYLRRLARYHLLLVVFFENTEIHKLTANEAFSIEEIYTQIIAQKFTHEKKVIARELSKYGIMPLISTPANLTVDLVNKYLELKSRMII
ncbi:DUF58 domain-containing protein [Chitinophaga horti]|uniref:DUF58 domain-containing protein n=1 Tax=Chitinophaga horti TaxID=2920382 RepID=A0ABY6IZ10_9BACT|nr:DUF58 domain-containing protein [Chitinophaga horti]UYQ92610.1 DUF58 domain-containing protein [Chitinophaga horti]